MASELEWRRHWTTNLHVTPWKSIMIDTSVFLMKALFKDDSYSLLLSDLSSVWTEDMDSVELKKRLANLNPSIEAPPSKIIDHIKANLISPNESSKKAALTFTTKPTSSSQRVEILMTSNLAGMQFMWKFCALLAPKDALCEHLTMPLLTMVSEMSRRQSELISRLASKDKEIADYKSQGVRTSRKHLETPVFDVIDFTNEMSTSKDLEEIVKSQGMTSFTPTTCDLYTTLMTKYAWLTHIPDDSDDSESLLDDSPQKCRDGSSAPSWGNRLPQSFSPLRKSTSPKKSLTKSPTKSPQSNDVSMETEDTELVRREALNRKLADKDDKTTETTKRKKKKIAF